MKTKDLTRLCTLARAIVNQSAPGSPTRAHGAEILEIVRAAAPARFCFDNHRSGVHQPHWDGKQNLCKWCGVAL